VPDSLADRDAAAVPEAFVTAHDSVFTRAGLTMGETLLVNGANGGVGTAAIQLGVSVGARVLANARVHHDRLAALGAEPVALGEASGVDVVLELVGAQNLTGSLEALAARGRVIVVGTGAGADTEVSLRTLMGKRASVMGTMLRARPLEEKAAAVQAFAHQVVPLLASGRVRPLVDRVFQAEQAVDAFDHLAGPGKFGKVLLQFASP
jgi:NADPH:quinone reductase